MTVDTFVQERFPNTGYNLYPHEYVFEGMYRESA